MHKYLPHTDKDILEMLKVTGAKSIDDLFSSIPKSLRLKNLIIYQVFYLMII
jgi:glycine dehydrogenase subunit 1